MENDLILKKEWFIQKNQGNIIDHYQFDQSKYLGKGRFGNVVKAIKRSTSNIYAIKIIKKKKIKDRIRLINQVSIMNNLDHPNVVRLFEVFQTIQKLYLVIEFCQGGELFDKTIKNGRLAQNQARIIFREIVLGIAYCHTRNICHRDLKPENILLLNNKADSPIKIIDFGIASTFNKEGMKTKAGTVYYISPEVLAGKYDELCDVWSLGVILYFLVSGVPPFYGEDETQIIQMIQKIDYTFDMQQFQGVSGQVKNLISLCLQPRQNRISAQKMLNHVWLKKITKIEDTIKLTGSLFNRFHKCSKLKIIILSYMATQLNHSQSQKYSKIFRDYDSNNDGFLEYSQLEQLLRGSGIESLEEIKGFIYRLDTQKIGKITYNEFLAATMKPEIYTNKQLVYSAFRLFDKKNKGHISIEDFRSVLKLTKINELEWKKLLQQANSSNKNNVISYNQFSSIMMK